MKEVMRKSKKDRLTYDKYEGYVLHHWDGTSHRHTYGPDCKICERREIPLEIFKIFIVVVTLLFVFPVIPAIIFLIASL